MKSATCHLLYIMLYVTSYILIYHKECFIHCIVYESFSIHIYIIYIIAGRPAPPGQGLLGSATMQSMGGSLVSCAVVLRLGLAVRGPPVPWSGAPGDRLGILERARVLGRPQTDPGPGPPH